jgi:hypothetical protein
MKRILQRSIITLILALLSVVCAWAGGPAEEVPTTASFNAAVASVTATLATKPASPVSIANGGTGATASSAALTALGGGTYTTGTFTPLLTADGGGTATYGSQVGMYSKIGNVVNYSLYITITNMGTLNGNLSLGGFPFNCKAGTGFYQSMSFQHHYNFALTTGTRLGGLIGSVAGKSWTLTEQPGQGGVDHTKVSDGAYLFSTGSYISE